MLKESSNHAVVLKLDPADQTVGFTKLEEVVENLETILDRIRRIFTSGMDAVMLQKHSIGPQEVLSMQCHDGKYAAMVPPGGTIHFASTRDGAVTKLREAEHL